MKESGKMKPLVFDLFCGLGGWSEAFISEGYKCIGFDIEAHDYGSGGYPGELVLVDVRKINGAELVKVYGVPACIVASPPCQEFSYMAMPWSKAKEKERKILADPKERERLCELFNQCFRIQREVSEAAGRYIPIVIENVRGANKWVGRSRWNFGSFHLWGDVPALMPIPMKLRKSSEGSWDLTRENYNPDHSWKREGNKTAGMNWSDQTKRGQDFTRIAGKQALEGTKLPGCSLNPGASKWRPEGVKVPSDQGRRTDVGTGAGFTSRDCGLKDFKDFKDSPVCLLGSKSKQRKKASAEIAKIPPALAQWIAKCFKP